MHGVDSGESMSPSVCKNNRRGTLRDTPQTPRGKLGGSLSSILLRLPQEPGRDWHPRAVVGPALRCQ